MREAPNARKKSALKAASAFSFLLLYESVLEPRGGWACIRDRLARLFSSTIHGGLVVALQPAQPASGPPLAPCACRAHAPSTHPHPPPSAPRALAATERSLVPARSTHSFAHAHPHHHARARTHAHQPSSLAWGTRGERARRARSFCAPVRSSAPPHTPNAGILTCPAPHSTRRGGWAAAVGAWFWWCDIEDIATRRTRLRTRSSPTEPHCRVERGEWRRKPRGGRTHAHTHL